MMTGTVKWFNADKGFGFITREDGKGDLFAHFSQIKTDGFKTLNEGDVVSFNITKGDRGEQASDIVRL